VEDDEANVPTGRWAEHRLAAAFDLISSEYGWTDDQILDLTLSRLWLVQEMILDRKREEQMWQATMLEQHAKATLGGMVALTWDRKAARSLQKYAQKLQFVKRPKELPSFEQVKRLFGGG